MAFDKGPFKDSRRKGAKGKKARGKKKPLFGGKKAAPFKKGGGRKKK